MQETLYNADWPALPAQRKPRNLSAPKSNIVYIVLFLGGFLHFPANFMSKHTYIMKIASFENRKFKIRSQRQPDNSIKKSFGS